MAGWTLGATLRATAAACPDRCCLRDMDGIALSYREVLVNAQRRAAGLQRLGVRPGDRVALVMDNSVEMIVTWFAINLLGGVEVPANTANRGRSLEHVIDDCGAGVAVVDAHYGEHLVEIAGALAGLHTVVVRGTGAELPWPCHDLHEVAADPSGLDPAPVTYRDPAAIVYTSGTTGPAKGVVMSHAQAYLFAAHVVEQLRISRDDVYYVCLPLFHANAQFMQVYASLIAGATIVLADGFSASGWIHDLHATGATVTSLLGVMAQYVHRQPPSDLDASHSVRRMITIPLPREIAEDFEQRFATRCVEAYGMTEICLPMYRPIDEPLRPGSCGKPLREWFDVAIVDPQTDEPLAAGEVGEIVVRPRRPFSMFLGYHDKPQATVDAWRNLWFHTGDAGWCDADGYYYFADRINDRIRRKGENITAYDIEVALTELAEVADAAVVAKPADEGEDDIKAFLVLEPHATIDFVAVLEHCAARLSYFSVPRYFEVVAELPKTASGKVLKRELRAHEPSAAEWDRERAGYTVRRTSPHVVRQGA